jgi:hypothetical protein
VFWRLVLLAFTSSAIALGAGLNGCLALEVKPAPPGEADKSLTLTLTNNCGKDITAYHVDFRDASGQVSFGSGQDALALLAVPKASWPRGLDIYRAGATWSQDTISNAPWVSASATAALYADMTVEGEPEGIAALVQGRKDWLLSLRSHLEILSSYEAYAFAKELPRDAAEGKAIKGSRDNYISLLANRFSRSDETSWNAFVQHERLTIQDTIRVFEDHLAAEDLSGIRKPAK